MANPWNPWSRCRFPAWTQTWSQTWTQRSISLLLAAVLMLGLSSCGAQGPETRLVKRAIALEFQQAQETLSQQLRTPVPRFKIQRVAIDEQTPLRIEGLSAFRVQGHYDVEVTFPDQRYHQTGNGFDLYLQELGEGQAWQLAIPHLSEAGQQLWETHLLLDPIEGAA